MIDGAKPAKFSFTPIIIGLGVWFGFCWSMLGGYAVPGFRDSAYLYYPLFEWLDSQWQSGTVPLWNPYCNFGMPNIGDNTTSLLYPGKVIFGLRFLSYPLRYGLYISVHILLAGLGTYWLARRFHSTTAGATLAAISYAGSGVVLTQATNVIYLVSAAWLPLALLAVWQLTRTGRLFYWGLAAGICNAMMILGGDPQMVYHLGLIAGATVGWQLFRAFGRVKSEDPAMVARRKSLLCSTGLLTMIATTTLLALVQIYPTYQWSKLSERTSSVEAISVYQALQRSTAPLIATTASPERAETASYDNTDAKPIRAWRNLIEPPQPGTVAFNAYEFSLSPWSMIELLIPNANGKLFPTHQRWSDGLASPQGSPDRVWYPSIYLGWLTAWLALGGLRFKGRGKRAWLSRVMIFFWLGSLGWYGLCWLLPIPQCGSQVGGVYWWMLTFLPGYGSFRYPAKLFLIASLCLSVLAGMRLNERQLSRINPFQTTWGWVLALLLAVGTILIFAGPFDTFSQRLSDDPLFGPFDVSAAKWSLLRAIVHSLAVLTLVSMVCHQLTKILRAPGQSFRLTPNTAAWLLVALTGVELLVANYWVLALVPSSTFTTQSESLTELPNGFPQLNDRQATATPTNAPITIYRERDAFLPASWSQQGSHCRLEEIVQWQMDTIYPKHHLGRNIRLLGSFSSIQPRVYEQWLTEIEKLDSAADYSYDEADSEKMNRSRSRLRSLADGVLTVREIDGKPQTQIRIWRPKGSLLDLVKHPQKWLEARRIDKTVTLSAAAAAAARPEHMTPSENIKDMDLDAEFMLQLYSSNSVEMTVLSRENGYLLHSCLWDGNWEARIHDTVKDQKLILRMTEVMPGYQGIPLSAGSYRIQLVYNPTGFWIAAWISGISWIVGWVAWIGLSLFPRNKKGSRSRR